MSLTKAALAVFCVLTMAVASARADEPILIRFSHVVGENTPKGIGAKMFKQRVEERLAGKVEVVVYPRSQKFNDNQVLLALLFGDVEMAAPSLAKFRSYAKSIQVFDLPFLFKDVEHVHRFQNSETGRRLLDAMLPRSIKGLAYWDNGMRVISANKPVRAPKDADRLVFRIEPSAVFLEQWARVGAVGIPMPFKRVTDAIREGLVKAQENAWSNIYSRKIHTLHRYFTEIDHTFLGYMVVTNQDFWEGLPDDIRSALEEILAEVAVEVNRLAGERAMDDRRKVMETGTVEIISSSPAEVALWREAMMPVWKQFEAEIGKDVIDAAVAAAEVN
jgi:C4-dicarboxylate-binding protein DctP